MESREFFYVENCGIHKMTEDFISELRQVNKQLRFLSKNQPIRCSLVTHLSSKKNKTAWVSRLEAHKIKLMKEVKWAEASEKITNPGKKFLYRSLRPYLEM